MNCESTLRVLHIGKYYPPHKGGMETHLEQLSRGLRDKVNLQVLVASDGRSSSVEYLDGVRIARVARLLNVASTPICPRLPAAIRASRAELVHVHFPNPSAVLAYLASGHKGTLVVTWHSDIVRQSRLARLFQPALNRFLRRCSAIIASSPNYLLSSAQLRANRQKCHMIPFGIPVERFERPNDEAVAAIRARFGSPIVLTVGRLVYYKGIEFLIRAMTKVRGTLLIVGDGPLRETLERQALDLGVADRIVFLGQVDDVVDYYHACDVFVLPSIARSEAFGMVQLEALAAGRPVVNTLLSSGVPFVSVDGLTGFSVAPGDSEALAVSLNRLLGNSALRWKFGQEGIRRVKREFTIDKMVGRTIDLYRKVLAPARPAGLPVQAGQFPAESGIAFAGRMAAAARES